MATAIPHGRLAIRTEAHLPCKVSWNESDIFGTAKNISTGGIAVTLPAIILPQTQGPAHITLQETVQLSAIQIHARIDGESFVIGFQVTKIEAGEQLWKQWNTASRLSSARGCSLQ